MNRSVAVRTTAAGILLALTAGLSLLPEETSASPPPEDPPRLSSDRTLRGVRDWERVLGVVKSRLEKAGKENGSPLDEALCVLVDVDAPVEEILGSVELPFVEFLMDRRSGFRVGVLGVGDRAVGTPPPGAGRAGTTSWFRSTLGAFPEPRIDWPALYAGGLEPAVLRSLDWLKEAKGGGVLLVLTTRLAALGPDFDLPLRRAKDRGTAVIVAGPEAPYATPPRVQMKRGGVMPIPGWPAALAVICDTRVPDVNLLTVQNVGAVHTWDSGLGDPWHREGTGEDAKEVAADEGVDPDTVLRRWATFPEWPEASPTDRKEHPECTGFPSIPSGFGYWPLTRLAALTGGHYLILGRRTSRCPLRARYDTPRLARMSPALDPDEPRSGHWKELEAIVRGFVDAGIVLDWQVRGAAGGVMPLGRAEGLPGLTMAFLAKHGCRREAAALTGNAARCAKALDTLADLRARLVAGGAATPDSTRLLGAVDACRTLAARARYHLLARAAVLEEIPDGAFDNGSTVEILLLSRICRFWDGPAAAAEEVARNGEKVPKSARDAFAEALAVSRSVEEEWSGTPIGAVARSGALWVYCPRIVLSSDPPEGGIGVGGFDGLSGPAPVPTSGSGGTGD